MICLSRSYHLKFFKGCLSTANFTWSIVEYFAPFTMLFLFIVSYILFFSCNFWKKSNCLEVFQNILRYTQKDLWWSPFSHKVKSFTQQISLKNSTWNLTKKFRTTFSKNSTSHENALSPFYLKKLFLIKKWVWDTLWVFHIHFLSKIFLMIKWT